MKKFLKIGIFITAIFSLCFLTWHLIPVKKRLAIAQNIELSCLPPLSSIGNVFDIRNPATGGIRQYFCIDPNGVLTLQSGNVIFQGPRPYVDVTNAAYKCLGDGVTDNTPCFNLALAVGEAIGAPIYFPCGNYIFNSAPNHVKSGMPVIGCGAVASNPAQGTTLSVNYNEATAENAFLWWDGSSTLNAGMCCNGTGGGPRYLAITKQNGKTGGTAIKYSGTGDNFRAGFDDLEDVIVTATGTGSWQHGFIIDGTCCTTGGTQGVRDHLINGLYVFNSTISQQAILLKNAIHVFIVGGITAQGVTGAVDSGITCTGNGTGFLSSTHVYIAGMEINGSFNADFCQQFLIDNNYMSSGVNITANAILGRVGGISGGTISNLSTGVNRVQVLASITGNAGALQTVGSSMGASFDNTAATTQSGRLFTRDGATSGTLSYGDGTCFSAMASALTFNFNCGNAATFSFAGAGTTIKSAVYATTTNCAVNSVSPAACGASASGVFAIPASQTSYTVNTSAVTANSRIFVKAITDNTGIPSAPTCIAPTFSVSDTVISSRVAATSFTLTLASNAGITCYNYWIVD